jgi:hypothetical protein
MMRVSLELRPEQIARWLAEDWEELAAVLPLLAGHVLKQDHEEFRHFFRNAYPAVDRVLVRELAWQIYRACREAE